MNFRRLLTTLLLVALALSLTACTLIRDRDPVNSANGGGEITPRVIDAIILVDLPRGAVNVMPSYARYMGYVEIALAAQYITIDRVAVAPMYRTQSSRPPLLYGYSDPYAPFSGLEEALVYYVSDDGLTHLDGEADADGENLAALGINLDRETIFQPFEAPPEAIPYYREASDGFVVFYLTGSSRRCAHDSPDCALNQLRPAEYFTEPEDETGFAEWLSLPGPSGVAPGHIMHIAVATEEGVDYEAFADRCLREPNFPANHLDLLEPSTYAYFGPLMAELRQSGGNGLFVDLCTAFSTRGEYSAVSTAAEIGRMLR
jgi:hypothetical protein